MPNVSVPRVCFDEVIIMNNFQTNIMVKEVEIKSDLQLDLTKLDTEGKHPEEDYDDYIDFSIPNSLRIPTNIPDLDGLQKCDSDKIFQYLNDIMSSEYRLCNIDMKEYRCGHCLHIACSSEYDQDMYYYCDRCQKHMCLLCFSETSEEIAIKNCARNWARRKDSLNACREHGLQKRIGLEGSRVCNVCDKHCEDTIFYSNLTNVNACENCVNNGLIDSTESQLMKLVTEPGKVDHFGSILDWVPLYIHEDDEIRDFILFCANPENLKFKRYALGCWDSHARMGIFPCSEKDTLDVLINECKEMCKKIKDRKSRYEQKKASKTGRQDDAINDINKNDSDDDSDESTESSVNSVWGEPIKMMMRKRDMETYFG